LGTTIPSIAKPNTMLVFDKAEVSGLIISLRKKEPFQNPKTE
jgi:hypothetical protein